MRFGVRAASQSSARFSAAATQLSCTRSMSGKGRRAAHLEEYARVHLLAEFSHGLGIEACHIASAFGIRSGHFSRTCGTLGGNALRLKPGSNEDHLASD